jgi:hypothetical protein
VTSTAIHRMSMSWKVHFCFCPPVCVAMATSWYVHMMKSGSGVITLLEP